VAAGGGFTGGDHPLALSVDAVSTIQTALAGNKVLATLRAGTGTGGGAGSMALADGLAPGPFDSVRIVVSVKEADAILQLAIAAGNTIQGALESLHGAIAVAGRTSLVFPGGQLTIDGMRVSRVNLDSEVNLAIQRIDALVANTEFAGANLISSTVGNVSLQTSAFGGSVDITPQPLDSAGLGLQGLDLFTDVGVQTAGVAVDKAIKLAALRVGRLKELRGILFNPDVVSTGAAAILARGESSVLPRGSVVNLRA